MSLDTQKERRECGAEKIYEEMMAKNFPDLAKTPPQTYRSRSSANRK